MKMDHSSMFDDVSPANRRLMPIREVVYPAPANAKSEMERIRNAARQEGNVANNVLKLYGAERAVARIAQSTVADRAVLKGGYLLRQVLPSGVRRTTFDADFFISSGTPDEAVADIKRAIMQPHPEDHVVFDQASLTVAPLQEDKGIRFEFKGMLGESQIDGMLDIGFYASVVPGPEQRLINPMLRHAKPFVIKAYPIALVAAEKYETILARQGKNTRLKDYYDLAALAELQVCSQEGVRAALEATCAYRGTSLLTTKPDALSPSFSRRPDNVAAWMRMTTKGLAMKQVSLEEVCDQVWKFFGPVVGQSERS